MFLCLKSFFLFLSRQASADDEAPTSRLHICLSLVMSTASRMSRPSDSISSITFFIHVFAFLPLLLCPSIWACSAFNGNLPFSILETCPNHVNLLFLILSIIVVSCPISLHVISLRILSLLDLPRIPLNQPISATSNLLSSSFFRLQHSAPYSSTGITSVS